MSGLLEKIVGGIAVHAAEAVIMNEVIAKPHDRRWLDQINQSEEESRRHLSRLEEEQRGYLHSAMIGERIEWLIAHDANIQKCDADAVQFARCKTIRHVSLEQSEDPAALRDKMFYYIVSYDERLKKLDETLLRLLFSRAITIQSPTFDNIPNLREEMARKIREETAREDLARENMARLAKAPPPLPPEKAENGDKFGDGDSPTCLLAAISIIFFFFGLAILIIISSLSGGNKIVESPSRQPVVVKRISEPSPGLQQKMSGENSQMPTRQETASKRPPKCAVSAVNDEIIPLPIKALPIDEPKSPVRISAAEEQKSEVRIAVIEDDWVEASQMSREDIDCAADVRLPKVRRVTRYRGGEPVKVEICGIRGDRL